MVPLGPSKGPIYLAPSYKKQAEIAMKYLIYFNHDFYSAQFNVVCISFLLPYISQLYRRIQKHGNCAKDKILYISFFLFKDAIVHRACCF